MPYPTTPINPHGRALKTLVLKIYFLCYKQNNFWKVSDRGQFSAALLHPGHFQGPSHTLLVFLLKLVSCPVKGLAFFHCSSISTDREENLCWERRDWLSFYNRANCLRLPHSVKCLLCCSQLIRKQKVGQRGLTAEQRCHASVHLKPRLQWETSPFQAFLSSSKGQVPGSKFQSAIPPVWIHNLEEVLQVWQYSMKILKEGRLSGFVHQDWLMEKD